MTTRGTVIASLNPGVVSISGHLSAASTGTDNTVACDVGVQHVITAPAKRQRRERDRSGRSYARIAAAYHPLTARAIPGRLIGHRCDTHDNHARGDLACR
jgi:hypothetical protein